MAKRIKQATKDYLISVPLPNHADTYTVISHQSIIDYAYAELANQGFGIVDEEYRCTHDGQVAQGIYKLQYNSDPEMSIMFAWTNSYNKLIRFKCVTGAYIHSNQTVMIPGEMGNYARKHTGTADVDTINSMRDQIQNAKMYYDLLVDDKNVMKAIDLSSRKQAELLGVLFAEYEVLNTEQASIIRQQMDKPSYFYNGGKNTLWAFYNHVTLALQQSHPRTWMEDQRMLHWFISNEFDLRNSVPVTDMSDDTVTVDPLLAIPNQTNILDQIADLEADQMDEDIRYAAAEEDENEPEFDSAGFTVEDRVIYTDPAGNTFEAPVVDKTFVDQLTEAISEKFETEVDKFAWEVPTLEPTPEEHELFEAELGESYSEVTEQELEVLNEKLEAREIRTIAEGILEEEENNDFDFDFDLSDDEDESSDNLFL
jgi:hypothetical protein